jgi:hypothetical protein
MPAAVAGLDGIGDVPARMSRIGKGDEPHQQAVVGRGFGCAERRLRRLRRGLWISQRCFWRCRNAALVKRERSVAGDAKCVTIFADT